MNFFHHKGAKSTKEKAAESAENAEKWNTEDTNGADGHGKNLMGWITENAKTGIWAFEKAFGSGLSEYDGVV